MTRIIDFENRTEWDKIVRSFPDYDVYFLSGYLASFKVHGDGTPILVYYQRGGLRAVCAFMLRDLNDEVWAQRYIGKLFCGRGHFPEPEKQGSYNHKKSYKDGDSGGA